MRTFVGKVVKVEDLQKVCPDLHSIYSKKYLVRSVTDLGEIFEYVTDNRPYLTDIVVVGGMQSVWEKDRWFLADPEFFGDEESLDTDYY